MTIGERIKQRRIELGLTQTELAHRLGNKSRTSVCTVETNREDLTMDRIRKYAEALETTPAYLMGWEETNEFKRRTIFEAELQEQGEKDAEAIIKYKKTPTVSDEEMRRLEQSYVAAQVIKRYNALLNDPQIQRLLLAAETSSPEQINMAINLLSLKKV